MPFGNVEDMSSGCLENIFDNYAKAKNDSEGSKTLYSVEDVMNARTHEYIDLYEKRHKESMMLGVHLDRTTKNTVI